MDEYHFPIYVEIQIKPSTSLEGFPEQSEVLFPGLQPSWVRAKLLQLCDSFRPYGL